MAASSLQVLRAQPQNFDYWVRRSVQNSIATIELHDYQFYGPQQAEYRFERSFLDLALTPRPGRPRGRFLDSPACGTRDVGSVLFLPVGARFSSEWGAGRQRSICLEFHKQGHTSVNWGEEALAQSLDVRDGFVNDALARLAQELLAPGFESALMIEALCTQIGIELGRYFRGRAALPETRANHLSPGQLRLVEAKTDLPGPLPSVEDFARECGMSTRSFFRLFRATAGMTLSEYAAQRRIARARARLAEGRVPIKQVAWECGFETPAAFSAAFRRATGLRPRDFRRLAKS